MAHEDAIKTLCQEISKFNDPQVAAEAKLFTTSVYGPEAFETITKPRGFSTRELFTKRGWQRHQKVTKFYRDRFSRPTLS